MIVKYRSNNNDRLTTFKEYEVISVSMTRNLLNVNVRILDDVGVPVLFPLKEFEIVDNACRPSWGMLFEPNSIDILPVTFIYPSFWEDFFDDEPTAIEIFLKEFPEYKGRGMTW